MGLLDKFKKNKDDEVLVENAIKFRKLFEAGKHEEQLELIEKMYLRKTESYYYSRGNVLSSLGRSQEALVSFQTALKLDPKYVKASYRAGQLFFQDEQYGIAHEYFSDMMDMETENNERENIKFEWSNAGLFYLVMCRHREYQKTKDSAMLETRDTAVRILTERCKFKNGEQDLFEFFEEHFHEILDEAEPNILVEFRLGKDKKQIQLVEKKAKKFVGLLDKFKKDKRLNGKISLQIICPNCQKSTKYYKFEQYPRDAEVF